MTAVTDAKRTILLHTAVWGDWHIDALVNVTIPSLLAAGNLPHMAQCHDLGYVISTRPSDRPRIEAAPSFQRLKQIIPIQIQTNLPEVNTGNVFVIHHVIWRDIQERAKAAGVFLWNMPPDVAFADGAGVTLTKLLAKGKRSIIWWYARTADTVVPVLKGNYLQADATMSIAPRELVELSFEHMHPLSNAYFVDSPCFANFHPEMLQWRVSENAMLVRMLASANWLYEPGHFKLTHQHLLGGDLNLDEVAVIDDSDDLFVASLAPVKHNAEWYEKPDRIDPVATGRWWHEWSSPANDFIAGHSIRMHAGDVSGEVWRRYEDESGAFLSRITVLRHAFDLAKCAMDANCMWAAGVLISMCHHKQELVSALLPERTNIIVFGPTDDFAKLIPVDVANEATNSGHDTRLRRLMTASVAIDEHEPGTLMERMRANGGVLRLRSPAGNEFVLAADAAGQVSVNGVPVMTPLKYHHGNLFVPIAGVLDPELLQEIVNTLRLRGPQPGHEARI